MANFSSSEMGNYRRYLSPSLGEFDVNLMMEKAAAISMRDLKDSKDRTEGGNDSFVLETPRSSEHRGVQMFRQRAQVDTGGIFH